MKIWCLFSVASEYDQPRNNLAAWWQEKPSIEKLAAFLAKPLDKADDEDIAKIVDIWRGKPANLGYVSSPTEYRLEQVSEGGAS
jgi:hypothetical protein